MGADTTVGIDISLSMPVRLRIRWSLTPDEVRESLEGEPVDATPMSIERHIVQPDVTWRGIGEAATEIDLEEIDRLVREALAEAGHDDH